MTVFGIDFGTSYSSISAVVGDRVCMIGDEEMRALHPSCVTVADAGAPVAGWPAREQQLSNPNQTLGSPKRLLGLPFDDEHAAAILHGLPMRGVAAPDGSIALTIDHEPYTITQLCVPIIAHLRDLAERVVHAKVEQAVFSVPLGFDDRRRAALRRAAQLAGIETIAQIEEPVAAAMAYGFGKQRNEVVAVYDFGGGTFDFTVIDISGYSFQVLARAGDAWLGGDDFDLSLAKAVADAIWRATEIEVRDRAVEWQRLLFGCEQVKRDLSEVDRATLRIKGLIERPKVVNLNQPITRDQLEGLCGEHVDRSISLCQQALKQAGLEPDDIAQVVVSGGVSHIPFVREAVAELFARPIEAVVDPDIAICVGAGMRAAQLSKKPIRGAGGVLCPH
ncbi:MAG: Hsp70 family protein [Deltaproteobacteria bacterium]|nr:Hsp70 family protein [Deltaproteobacteria bacterium]